MRRCTIKFEYLFNFFFTVDVRFKNNGLDSIEVQDNGGGVSPENYQTIGTVILQRNQWLETVLTTHL